MSRIVRLDNRHLATHERSKRENHGPIDLHHEAPDCYLAQDGSAGLELAISCAAASEVVPSSYQ